MKTRTHIVIDETKENKIINQYEDLAFSDPIVPDGYDITCVENSPKYCKIYVSPCSDR